MAALCAGSLVAIARVWRAGERWYLLPRPGLPGGMAQAADLHDNCFCQWCQQCRTCQRRRPLSSPKNFPFQQTWIYGRRKSLRPLRMTRRRQSVSATGFHGFFTLTAWQGSRAVRPNVGKGRREGGGWSGHARVFGAGFEPDPGSSGWESQRSGSGSPQPRRPCPMPAGSRPPLVAWSPPGRGGFVVARADPRMEAS